MSKQTSRQSSAWAIQTSAGYVIEPFTEQPREWPSERAAKTWAELSWPRKVVYQGAITHDLYRPYTIERLR